MRTISEDDLTSDGPGPEFEERIVRALRERGLLGQLGQSRASRPLGAWLSAAAAGVVLFAGGLAVGEYHGVRRIAAALEAENQPDVRHAAALVQRTGTEYVTAVAKLAEVTASGKDANDASQGREVAVSALRAAAVELQQVAPDDPLTLRILEVVKPASPDKSTAAGRRVIWY
jgi:hypothetical protein